MQLAVAPDLLWEKVHSARSTLGSAKIHMLVSGPISYLYVSGGKGKELSWLCCMACPLIYVRAAKLATTLI